jgi:hypothetical protein
VKTAYSGKGWRHGFGVLGVWGMVVLARAEEGVTLEADGVVEVAVEERVAVEAVGGLLGRKVFEEGWAAELDAVWLELAMRAGVPAIYASVLMGDEAGLLDYLAHGAWVDERTAGGDTAVAAAFRFGAFDLARLLVGANADTAFSEVDGQPLLILAALRRQTEGMRLLLATGADVNARTRHPVSRALIEAQALKDLKGALDWDRELTALMICSAHGDVAGVELLMAAGAKQSLFTKVSKRYAINFASAQGYTYIMQLLLGRKPGEESEQRVVVNLARQKAELYRDGLVVDTTTVSTGRKGYSTPPGTFVITNKHTSWVSTIYKVSMPWFMRLNCGSIGMHAGNIPGYPASHGCIRLPHAKAKAFFGQLRVGDVVEVSY